ncbi:MAG TPA: L,D-transpeptidase family protein [Mycobacteriales bacterium]|nr:L,D-transpeptidase family protein [Mycobacteriales bacterium]
MPRTFPVLPLAAGLLVTAQLVLAPVAFAADPPTITAVDPSRVRTGGSVTVSGTALAGATSAAVGATQLSIQSKTDSQLVAVVPAGATSGAVTVTTPDGTATSPSTLTVVPPPVSTFRATPGDGFIDLTWSGAERVTIRALAGEAAPATPAEGRAVYSGLAGSVRDSGLVNGQRQSYGIWALAADGAPSDRVTASATPTPVLGTALSLATSVTRVVAGATLTLTGRLTRSDGAAVPAAPVDVFLRQGGTTNVARIAQVTTDANGNAVHTFVPRVNAEYHLSYAGDAILSPSASPKRIVAVQPRLSSSLSPAAITYGQTATLRGQLAPAYAGVRLHMQRRMGTSWQTIALVGINAQGDYSWPVRPGLLGTYAFRAALAPTHAYLGTTSPAHNLRVDPRTLRQGDRGSDVETLERRLLAQKAFVGKIDGVFDYDLRHAVTAFQKAQGLPRTGAHDTATQARLAAPRAISVRFPSRGRAVEIDLRKQVLYLSEGGRLVRMVDVSTGNNAPYEADGVTYRAVTPKGRFSIQRKIDGVRVSRLGELYRPAYFHQGWAIHGSASVPTTPASHGCVRVTNGVMNHLFPLLGIGVPVTIHTG